MTSAFHHSDTVNSFFRFIGETPFAANRQFFSTIEGLEESLWPAEGPCQMVVRKDYGQTEAFGVMDDSWSEAFLFYLTISSTTPLLKKCRAVVFELEIRSSV